MCKVCILSIEWIAQIKMDYLYLEEVFVRYKIEEQNKGANGLSVFGGSL